MNNLNSILIEGRLTADPLYKNVGEKDTPLATFSIASNRFFKKDGELCRETSFFDIETWGKTAETINTMGKKGQGVRVIGRLKQSHWTDQNGHNRYRITIVGEAVEFRPVFTGRNADENNASQTDRPDEDEYADNARSLADQAAEAIPF
jgi:single-strand DNA-binding protein